MVVKLNWIGNMTAYNLRMSIVVSQLYFYPVKSCAGTALAAAVIGPRGIKYDRQWMVIDEDGYFLTQRQLSRMALIRPEINEAEGVLKLNAPDMLELVVKLNSEGQNLLATVWDDTCAALDEGDEASHWFTQFLGIKSRLVKFAADYVRKVDQKYAKRQDDQVGFADGFPFLLIGEASLADLNDRLSEELPMNRFRPNIVLSGAEAFAEDTWKKIGINGIQFDVVKPCARCVITTVNQNTGVASAEPLKTLAGFRRRDGKVLFGQNLAHASQGTIAIGDSVDILE